MNAGVQAGLVQLGIAGLLLLAWYSGAWGTIVDELVAGVLAGGPARRATAAPIGASSPFGPVGATIPTGIAAPRAGASSGGWIPQGV